jgi:hypothetical protein
MSSKSQTFNIVKCFNCSMYQVDINKKSTNKWQCKLCGSKQTLKQVFFESDCAKDCRERVKQLNSLNGQRQEQQQNANLARHLDLNNLDEYEQANESIDKHKPTAVTTVSKWAKYLTKKEFNKYYGDNNQDEEEDEEEQIQKQPHQNLNNNYFNNRNFY